MKSSFQIVLIGCLSILAFLSCIGDDPLRLNLYGTYVDETTISITLPTNDSDTLRPYSQITLGSDGTFKWEELTDSVEYDHISADSRNLAMKWRRIIRVGTWLRADSLVIAKYRIHIYPIGGEVARVREAIEVDTFEIRQDPGDWCVLKSRGRNFLQSVRIDIVSGQTLVRVW